MTAQRLMRFVALADKTALTALDHERWQQFVIACHLSDKPIDPDTVRKLLVVCGFAPERANTLANDLGSGIGILRAYDRHYIDGDGNGMQRRVSAN